jgi:hypothetical protein
MVRVGTARPLGTTKQPFSAVVEVWNRAHMTLAILIDNAPNKQSDSKRSGKRFNQLAFLTLFLIIQISCLARVSSLD